MSQRKTDHINMAASSIPSIAVSDNRFYYEPLLSKHPSGEFTMNFLGKDVRHPLWISSMTGGSAEAKRINHILAEACAEFGMGMGLGSCRTLLKNNNYFDDFNLRPIIGNELPFYANMGIAQIETSIQKGETERIHEIVHKLKADGLIIHVNPTQERLQPEGDLFTRPAIETIAQFIESVNDNYSIIIKEVGQGIGPESLKQLLKLKIDALEFGAFGGTNFANIEIMRNKNTHAAFMSPLSTFGHDANEMVEIVNKILIDQSIHLKNLIISGGLKNFLDGYYLTKKSTVKAVYGMAGTVLKHALVSKTELFHFLKAEKEGYEFAQSFLKIKQ